MKDVASATQLVRELAKIGFIGAATYRKFNSNSGPMNDCSGEVRETAFGLQATDGHYNAR